MTPAFAFHGTNFVSPNAADEDFLVIDVYTVISVSFFSLRLAGQKKVNR